MLIRLEHNGRIVQEIKSNEISGELTIGRSHTCTWPVPKEDTVASSRHAALFLKGSAVWIKDLESTNGTFFLGKKIDKKKLAIGDRIGVGNCTLCAEMDKTEGGKAVSELAVLTGKNRGQKKPLNPPVFTIGSDPSSSLVFLDMLVSRKHAEILIKEDNSCWIRDLGSKNGTSVNGLALRDDKERLLKDGDRIAISHLEMEFHDGAVKRSNKQAWLRMGVLAATLVIALSLFWAYQHVRASAEGFIGRARSMAADEKFAEANDQLEKAVNARHASACQVEAEDLRRLLGLWETTLGLWTSAQKSLSLGKWTQASRDLGMLQAARKEAWEWNDKATQKKEQALKTKQMLDALLNAQASIVREDISYAELAADNQKVKDAIVAIHDDASPHLARLKSELDAMQRRQEILLDEGSGMEKAITRLKEDPVPFDDIVKAVDKARKSSEGTLKRRANVLFEPIEALSRSYARYNEAIFAVQALNFRKAMEVDLRLPSSDACSLDLRVAQARQKLEKDFEGLKGKSGQISYLFTEIGKRLGQEEGDSAVVKALADTVVMGKVMACDSMTLPLPKRSRREAVGEYDRILGIEEFYVYMAAMPGPPEVSMLEDLPFLSVVTQMREAVVKIEMLKRFLAQPENRILSEGKVGEQMLRLDRVLARRDAIVKIMAAWAESGSGRAALIAGGITARLITDASITLGGSKPEEWVAERMKNLRADMMRLNSEYSMATPARAIEIRNKILAQGLPGDPVVRRMWATKDAATEQH